MTAANKLIHHQSPSEDDGLDTSINSGDQNGTGATSSASAHSHLTFQDEFQSFHIWDTATKTGWDVTGGPQWINAPLVGGLFGRVTSQGTFPFNNEQGYYLNPNYVPATVNPFSVQNGILDIKATPTPQTILGVASLDYTSGMITSFHSHTQLYGYFEIRAELPSASGFLPAFWLLPTNGSHGEIDAMEIATNDLTHLLTTVHSFSSGGATPVSTTQSTLIPDASQAFHTYGVDWEADHITWYFDGHRVFDTVTPADLHTPMYMIANLAVGGPASWFGRPAGTSADYQIDYIRTYASHNGVLTDQLDSHGNGQSDNGHDSSAGAQGEPHVINTVGHAGELPSI